MAASIRRLVVLVGLVALVLIVNVPVSLATFPGENGKIAFASCVPDCGLFLVDPDGGASTQVTHNPTVVEGPSALVHGQDQQPAWSADGRRIVYASQRGATIQELQTDLFVVDVATGQQHRLTNTAVSERAPVWSPDGTRIAFIRGDSNVPFFNDQLHVMNHDGTNSVQLTSVLSADAPDWSPDGSRIAFAVRQQNSSHHHFEIHTIAPAGSGQVALTSSTPEQIRSSTDPSWSPDGERILFARADVPFTCCREAYAVHVMNADGSGAVKLAEGENGFDARAPAWSPDRTQFTYDQESVWKADATGQNRTQLTEGLEPDWQPLVAPPTGPVRSDFTNASGYCKALREFLGPQEFDSRYKNHGKCVSANH
jgi:Tol biopolymer transport system component